MDEDGKDCLIKAGPAGGGGPGLCPTGFEYLQ